MRILWVVIAILSLVPLSTAQEAAPPPTCGFENQESADKASIDQLVSGWVDRLKKLTGSTKKIVGGNIACPDDWPYMVAFRYMNAGNLMYFCGGTMITDQWILTAAHCVSGTNGRFQVVSGTTDLVSEAGASVFNVTQVRVHPNYRPHNPVTGAYEENDIALVKLDRRYDGPVALLSDNIQADGDLGQGRAFVAGFGATAPLSPSVRSQPQFFNRSTDGRGLFAGSSKLLQTVIPLVSSQICGNQWTALDTRRSICAGYELGVRDSCEGDSGGPLVALDRNSAPYQIGLVSYGSGCAQETSYGVYTRISAYRDWIRFHVPAAAFYNAEPETDFALMSAIHQQLADKFKTAEGLLDVRLTSGPEFSRNELLSFELDAKVSGRLLVLDIDPIGRVTQLIPNQYMTHSTNQIYADETYTVPTRRFDGVPEFQMPAIPEPAGEGRLIALILPNKVFTSSKFEVIESQGFRKKPDSSNYIQNLVNLIEIQAIRSDGRLEAGWAFDSVVYTITE